MEPQWIGAMGQRACFRTRTVWGVEALTQDPDDLDSGFHVVVQTFEGELTAARMRHVERHDDWAGAEVLRGQHVGRRRKRSERRGGPTWRSDLSRGEYERGVWSIRAAIARGDVYQVNLCRTLTTSVPLDLDALFLGILDENPALHAARIDVDGLAQIVSASPETYLTRRGSAVSSAPIKGTARDAESMLDKDVTENVMITDLVRNDLQRVCVPGSIRVDPMLETQQHPGLVHLVSTVHGELRPATTWREILELTGPPGSVSGTPKGAALEVIDTLEAGPRGPYCGAIGWIDADRDEAELAVGIRTFWQERARPGADEKRAGDGLSSKPTHFGVGAGITWDSQPVAEWDETELKARRLLDVAREATLTEEP